MMDKKKSIFSAVSLAVFLILTQPFTAKAVMYDPENWQARTVEEVKMDLPEEGESYLLRWGDTLWAISEATGIPIQRLVDLNHIADRDFILAGHSLSLWTEAWPEDSEEDMTPTLTWSSMQEAIDFYEGNIIASNEEEVAQTALGSEFYDRDSWELIANQGDTIILSLNNVGVGGKDIIEFVKGEMNTVMTFYSADSPYPDRPTARQIVRNSDKVTIEREELNPIDPA